MIARSCLYCGKDFEARDTDVKRGLAKFCSILCSNKNKAVNIQPKPANVSCAYCGKGYYLSPSKISASRSGFFFCTRAHKDSSQKIGGIEAIMPSHYGKSKGFYDYRARAFSRLPNKCRVCGYDKYPEVLEVNHIDCNKNNNHIDNLEILCPTHHTEYHFTTKTGSWGQKLRASPEN